MKILMITMSPVESLTSAMLRNLAVVRGLVESGHQVTLISPENAAGATAAPLEEYAFLEKVRLVRTAKSQLREKIWTDPKKKSLKARLVNVLRKVYHAFSVLGSSKNTAKNISISLLEGETEFDVILSSSDPKPAHIAARSLIRQGVKYKKWIQYWGDPLTMDMTRKGLCPTFVVKRIEKGLLRGADRIVYVSPFTLEQQKKLFPSLGDKMDFLPIPYIKEKVGAEPATDPFRVSYVGAYHRKVRDLVPFYEALLSLEGRVEADIVGDSDLELAPTASIRIHPRGDARAIEEKSNLLVCLLNRSGTQIPGKIYHSAATDRPILVITDGERAEDMIAYLSSFDRFLVCANQKEEIRKAILSLMENPRSFAPCPAFSPVSVAQKMIFDCEA